MTDEQAMQRAIMLAMRGNGYVSPNPRVGAVIIKNNEIISEGWHEKFGGPHAEVNAIKKAGGTDLEGATIAVNLEPCSHQGKTPPCAPLLIEKKFKRVIIGMQDPNPEVSGSGIAMLKDAGIEVAAGVLEDECKWVNRFFIKHISTGMPYILAKIAQSLDGCIATSTGKSKWISCEESRRRSHQLRADLDAVLIGKNTAKIDDPKLTVRDVKGRDPLRIVFDRNLALPFGLQLFNDPLRKKTFVCYIPDKLTKNKAENLKLAGINLIEFIHDDGKVNLVESIRKISKELNINSIMLEGGAGTFSTFAENNLIDEIHFFVAPKIIGNGISSFNSFKTKNMNEAYPLKIIKAANSGDDLHVIAVRE